MNKINFLQKKYIIPLVALPFIIFIIYMIGTFKGPEKQTNLVQLDELNTAIQEPTSKKESVNKFDALKNRLKKEGDFTGIQNVEVEEIEDEMITNSSSLYTTDEMKEIDSLNQVNAIKREEIKKRMDGIYKTKDYTTKGNEEGTTSYSLPNQTMSPKDYEDEYTPEQVYQMKLEQQRKKLDSLASVRVALEEQNIKEIKQSHSQEVIPIYQSNTETDSEPQSIPVVKAKNRNLSYFNTVDQKDDNMAISAIIDESINVVAGSRVRIRILEDVTIGEYTLKQGEYLYGNVSGFTAQRVMITINSIMVKGKPAKVNLTIHDLDGGEGLYVPASAFRDFTKEAGSKAAKQNISIDSGNGGIQQLTYNLLKDVYQSGTQAISKIIRQNKANLKYATQIYLVNKDDQ